MYSWIICNILSHDTIWKGLQGSLENLSNSTAITLSWVSLISTGNFTVNVTNVTTIEIPTTNDPNLTVVISNLCPQSAYEVYVSGPPYLCVDYWQSTYYTQSCEWYSTQ